MYGTEIISVTMSQLSGYSKMSCFAYKYFGNDCIDIKEKYRELANLYHPDKGGNELMFKAITSAKEYLQTKLM